MFKDNKDFLSKTNKIAGDTPNTKPKPQLDVDDLAVGDQADADETAREEFINSGLFNYDFIKASTAAFQGIEICDRHEIYSEIMDDESQQNDEMLEHTAGLGDD